MEKPPISFPQHQDASRVLADGQSKTATIQQRAPEGKAFQFAVPAGNEITVQGAYSECK
jgi:hypothetical protein